MEEKIITVIDLGSAKICVIMALLNEDKIEIKGIATTESKGIENGLVLDLQKASETISKAVLIAQEQAGMMVENLFVGISGAHLRSEETTGKISIANGLEPSEINDVHLISVQNDAKNSLKSRAENERLEILHCIPMHYIIDDHQTIITNPIGMTGFSIRVQANVILAEVNQMRNLRKVFEMSNLPEPEIVLGALATSEVVLDDDEKNLGSILLDIGGGTTDIAIFHKSNLTAYLCIPMGGSLISHDLAVGLRTTPHAAENMKIESGDAVLDSKNPETIIEIEGIGGRASQQRPLSLISQIIAFRLKEILDICYKEMLAKISHIDHLTAGIIITGGTALLKNIEKKIENQDGFNLLCRTAYPNYKKINGPMSKLDDPRYSGILGLLVFAAKSNKIFTKKKSIANNSIIRIITDFKNKLSHI